MLFGWLHGLLYLLLLSWTATAEQFYVIPSNSTSCPRDPCYTLTDVVQNPSQYFTSNVVIIFLPGNHQTNITEDLSVLIKDVRNISMIGYDHTNTDSKSVIQCTGPLGFTFIKVTSLKISNLKFIFCGGKIPSGFPIIRNFPIQESRVTFLFLQTINLAISEVNISNSTGAGIIGVNMFGLSNISQTVISGNSPNCLIIFQEHSKDIPPTHFNIVNTHVTFGKIPKDLQKRRLNWGVTGLGIFLAQTTYNVHIHITNIKTHGNIRKKSWYVNRSIPVYGTEMARSSTTAATRSGMCFPSR